MIDAGERKLTVRVTAGRGVARTALLRRAVAATCARASLPVDRIDDALLIVEALLADRGLAGADEVQIVLTARHCSVELLIGPLPDSEAQRLLAEAGLPLVGPVVERLSTSAAAVEDGSRLLVTVDA